MNQSKKKLDWPELTLPPINLYSLRRSNMKVQSNQLEVEEMSQAVGEYEYLITVACDKEAVQRMYEFLNNQTGEPDDNYIFSIERMD
jgi:hypothetical protein